MSYIQDNSDLKLRNRETMDILYKYYEGEYARIKRAQKAIEFKSIVVALTIIVGGLVLSYWSMA